MSTPGSYARRTFTVPVSRGDFEVDFVPVTWVGAAGGDVAEIYHELAHTLLAKSVRDVASPDNGIDVMQTAAGEYLLFQAKRFLPGAGDGDLYGLGQLLFDANSVRWHPEKRIEFKRGWADAVPKPSFDETTAQVSLFYPGEPVAPGLHDSPFYRPTAAEVGVRAHADRAFPAFWMWGLNPLGIPPKEADPELWHSWVLDALTTFIHDFPRRMVILFMRWFGQKRRRVSDSGETATVDRSIESHRSRAPGRDRKTLSLNVFRELAPI